jgi:hypothetical protein
VVIKKLWSRFPANATTWSYCSWYHDGV